MKIKKKKCSKCKKIKALTDYYFVSTRGYYHSRCKQCMIEDAQQTNGKWIKENASWWNRYINNYYHTHKIKINKNRKYDYYSKLSKAELTLKIEETKQKISLMKRVLKEK